MESKKNQKKYDKKCGRLGTTVKDKMQAEAEKKRKTVTHRSLNFSTVRVVNRLRFEDLSYLFYILGRFVRSGCPICLLTPIMGFLILLFETQTEEDKHIIKLKFSDNIIDYYFIFSFYLSSWYEYTKKQKTFFGSL